MKKHTKINPVRIFRDFFDAFLKEIQDSWYIIYFIISIFFFHIFIVQTNSFFFFEKWNIIEMDEIRFYGVAPHWYFRPLMGILVIAPTHYEGLMWMGLFFILLTFLPNIYNIYNINNKNIPIIAMQNSKLQTICFLLFLMSLFYSVSILPCGRYYYEPEGGYFGNPWTKFAYQYIYIYLF